MQNFSNFSLVIVVVFLLQVTLCHYLALARDSEPASCHLRELELCAVGAASLFQNPNGIPLTQKDLKRQCEYLTESADCYESYSKNCMTNQHNSLFSLFDKDVQLVQEEFCDEKSELRKNFTVFGACLKDIQRKYQKICINDLQAGFESIHKLSSKIKLSTTCCNVNRFKDCIMDKIESECGAEVEQYINGIIVRIASRAFNNLCRNYGTKSELCKGLLPPEGTKPHAGRNTSAISRIVSSYANGRA